MLARKKNRRGFTLTELMVSLVMGLIVALAAVGLARNATTTFHEQARSSTTEMSLRMAANRLRQDLMRTSYMSTGNLPLDPKIARFETATSAAAIARYPELTELRGIRVDVNMQATDGGIPATLSDNGIKPDAIELVGNFTTDDSYAGTIQDKITTASSDGSCTNAQTIILDTAADAATYTLGGGSAGAVDATQLLQNAKAAFMPVAKKKFLAQVTDAVGCTHYVPVCDVNTASGSTPTKPVLHVMVDGPTGSRAVLYANSGAEQGKVGRNCGSSETGKVTIAPLSRVRWHLAPATAAILSDPVLEAADKKIDLVRDVMDFSGGVVFTEVVAEYMVDLKFGIVIDDPALTGASRQRVIDLDSDNGGGDIYKTTFGTDSILPGKPGPQRVRSVLFRVAARSAVADRKDDLPLDAGAVRARVCVDDPANCQKGWARVRTITSEVALINQAGMFY